MADPTIDTKLFRTEIEGDAARPALMLSHSLGVDLSMWEGQIPDLAQHFRVIRYDTRGHGGSAGGDGPTSIAQLGRDALAILDSLEIEKVHWVGLSMGGAIGLWLLANAPERIDRAVLANTAAKFGTPETWNARITAVLGDGMDDTAAATVERWFSADFMAREPKQVAAIHALLRKTSPEGYASCCAALRDMDLRESLGAIEHEVLVVSGRHDPVVSGPESKALVGAIAGARHVVLDALHLSNIEAATDFTSAIVTFLTAKPARAKPAGRQRAPAKAAPRKASARKTAPAKATPAKRGNATRRSNAARSPLKKAVAKVAVVKTATPVARTKKKPAATRRRPVAKTIVARRPTPKVAAKKRPAKSPRKTVTARRPTPTTTVRSPVKASPAKAPRVKVSAVKASAKVAPKKAKPSKTAVNVTKKTVAKPPAKKLPAARRKPVAKPRRPAGRRKP